MKKSILTIALALGFLTGCSSTGETPEETSTTSEDTAAVSETTDTDVESTDADVETTEESSTNTSTEATGDNLATIVADEEYFVSDDDLDNMLGSDGDTLYTGDEGREATGLVTTIEITDSGDGQVNLEESIHIKINLKNTGSSIYKIQQLHIDGGIMFEDDNWTNMIVTGGDEAGYELDNNRLDPNGSASFTFNPGDTFTFEVDASIGAGEEDKNIDRYDSENETKYVAMDFMATNTDDGTIYYYELGEETLNIDLTK